MNPRIMTSPAVAEAPLAPRRAGLWAHVSRYAAGNVAITVAGLVSFPLLTRLLTVDEYGLMNLVATALALLVALGKLGTQHAVLRMQAEVRVREGEAGLLRLGSTSLAGMAATGAVVALAWAIASQALPAGWWGDPRVAPLFAFTAVLVALRCVESALVAGLRADERSGALNTYLVAKRWATLLAVIAVLVGVSRDLWGFYAATLVVEVVALGLLVRHRLAQQPVAWHAVSWPQWRAMVAFGLPMLSYEAASIVLSMGDRTLVQQRLGAETLGAYMAAYNLCDYLRAALLAAAVAAAQPAYLRLHAEQGRVATTAFLARFVRLYVVAAAGLVAVTSAVGGPLLELLASARYAPGAVVVPWVMTALALDTLVVVLGAGLYLHKRTRRIAAAVFASALLNLALNALLLPRVGLVGAGIAAVAGYGTLLVLCAWAGRRALAVPLPWLALGRSAGLGLVAYAAAIGLDGGSALATVALRGVVVLAVYGAGVALLDRAARAALVALAQAAAHRAGIGREGT